MLLMVIVLCAGLVTAAPGKQPKDDSLNHYMDLVMDNLQVMLVENGLDPVALPNTSMGFSDTVLGVEWHGEAKLYDGWMRGLASIHRSANAEFIKNSAGVIRGILASLSLGEMKGHYVCLAKFMDLGPVADVFIDVRGSDVYFEALLDTHQCKFRAEVLKVTKLGSINVSIEGLSVLGWIVASLMDFVMIFIGGFVSSFVETVMKDMTDQVLDSIDLSLLGPVLGCDPAAAQLIQLH
ncbi:uncharacterized protein LOC123518099 [Portunus trituberculatus]|uniref:uncharacterized protein LOC123518099 n=1 Tax=Portunus trituberculatus TaxID=210409 RepID=UPI001E1CFCF4|nr:uncharacterized protein LOC123518099 [Portunus trituberculatus]